MYNVFIIVVVLSFDLFGFIFGCSSFNVWYCDPFHWQISIAKLCLRYACRLLSLLIYFYTTILIIYYINYIHKHNKLTPFSHGGRQKLQMATCYDPYILLSPRPHSYIWSYTHAGSEYYTWLFWRTYSTIIYHTYRKINKWKGRNIPQES